MAPLPTNSTLTYTFDPNNRGTGGFDFIGVAEHELSEIMGRLPGLGNDFGLTDGPLYMANDLFRYTAPGVLKPQPNRYRRLLFHRRRRDQCDS